VWLIQNNEDYKDVTIDQSLFERWPPVWVADNLLNLAGGLPLENGSDEENARTGIATEDVDTPEINGDLPFTASGIVDVNLWCLSTVSAQFPSANFIVEIGQSHLRRDGEQDPE
jgi:hypothetical protein